MVEDRLKVFILRLIKCNENANQIHGDNGKLSTTRSALFDVSFMMLTFIVQTYGIRVSKIKNRADFIEYIIFIF